MSHFYATRASRLQHGLANALTFGNLAAGIAATLMKGDERSLQRSRLILLGAACDAFDGTLARRSGHDSTCGARADGFSDMVTCGVAPAVLLARQGRHGDGSLVRLAPGIFLAGIAWRVVTMGFPTRTSHIFKGLPLTGAGLVIAFGAQARLSPRAMSWLSVAAFVAMVSRLPFPSGEVMVRPRKLRANGYRVSPPAEVAQM